MRWEPFSLWFVHNEAATEGKKENVSMEGDGMWWWYEVKASHSIYSSVPSTYWLCLSPVLWKWESLIAASAVHSGVSMQHHALWRFGEEAGSSRRTPSWCCNEQENWIHRQLTEGNWPKLLLRGKEGQKESSHNTKSSASSKAFLVPCSAPSSSLLIPHDSANKQEVKSRSQIIMQKQGAVHAHICSICMIYLHCRLQIFSRVENA